MSLKILRPEEMIYCNVEVLNESVEGLSNGKTDPFYYLKGPTLIANQKNKNGRFYKRDILKREADRFIAEFVHQKRAFGEFGHPDRFDILPEKISHMTIELIEDGDQWHGRHKVIKNPGGIAIQNIIDAGGRLGVSSRAYGSLEEGKDGSKMVGEDLHLICIDVVLDPSGPGCFSEAIVEGREFQFTNKKTGQIEVFDNDQYIPIIKNTNMRNREEVLLKVFNDFLMKL